VKSLGEVLRGSTGFSGASILPDGTVGLILDMEGIMKLASRAAVEQPAGGEWNCQMN
jgi:chemotaxis protein histidine kinase CheA